MKTLLWDHESRKVELTSWGDVLGGNLGGLGLPWERGSLFSVYFHIIGILFKFCTLCVSCLFDNNF